MATVKETLGRVPVIGKYVIPRDVDTEINPDIVHIVDEYDYNVVTVTIYNKSYEDIEVDITADVPEHLNWRHSDVDEDRTDDINETVIVSGPGSQTVPFQFRTVGDQPKTDTVPVELNYKYDIHKRMHRKPITIHSHPD